MVESAYWDEQERDTAFESNKNKCYLGKAERIIQPDEVKKTALRKLDGIDRLLLNL